MKRIGLILALALVAAACGSTGPVTAGPDAAPDGSAGTIAVSATGDVKGRPDTLTVTLGVSVLRPTVAEAVEDAAGLADGLISSLTGLGVASDDIQTTNYSIYPEYDWTEPRGRELIGYRVSNQLNVAIRDLAEAGATIDAATAAVGDEITVQGVAFRIDDDAELVEAARADAWAAAKAKAEQLAGLAGVRLGAPTSIREDISHPVPVYRAYAEFADGAATTPIEPGQLSVTVSLAVEFEIAG